MIPAVLTIAASDPSGGAGIEADLKVFARHGCFGMSAVTALTVQNAAGLQEVHPTPVEVFRKILAALATDQPVRAIKIGVLPNLEIIEAVADFLAEKDSIPVVLDPVFQASRGGRLAGTDTLKAIRERLLPRVTLFTPNLDEAKAYGLGEMDSAVEKGKKSFDLLGAKAVLVKGGHRQGEIRDVLIFPESVVIWSESRLLGNFHGLGCALSSAIAANLAQGKKLKSAVAKARAYVRKQMNKAIITPGNIKVLPHT
jgi:hydroxymethylpyrimidine/phosphomethylpyrimidine kinase